MTSSIAFRMPVVDKAGDTGPFVCLRASDDRTMWQWQKCGHKHRTKTTALRCARSKSIGWRAGSVNERIEIRRIGP